MNSRYSDKPLKFRRKYCLSEATGISNPSPRKTSCKPVEKDALDYTIAYSWEGTLGAEHDAMQQPKGHCYEVPIDTGKKEIHPKKH
jgi:hypothetical protein